MLTVLPTIGAITTAAAVVDAAWALGKLSRDGVVSSTWTASSSGRDRRTMHLTTTAQACATTAAAPTPIQFDRRRESTTTPVAATTSQPAECSPKVDSA